MSFYPPKVNEKFQSPRNAGKVLQANAVGTSASFVCGAFVRVSLRINSDTKEIVEAKYSSNGCGFMIAAAEVLMRQVAGRKLIELRGLESETLSLRIEDELGVYAESRKHCADVCFDALQTTLADFRALQIEEFNGEKVLICTCFGISEEIIENLIADKQLEQVEQVTRICGAGGGCGSCQPLIQDILDVFKRENYDILENY